MIWYNIRIGFRYIVRQKSISLMNLPRLSIGMTVAILTVSLQTWRAATKNPVEALRYE